MGRRAPGKPRPIHPFEKGNTVFGFELFASLAFVAVAGAICIFAFDVPLSLAPHFWAGAGSFPFIVGSIIFLLSAFWAIDLLRNRAKRRPQSPPETGSDWLEQVFGPADRRKRLFLIAMLTVVFVFLLIPLSAAIDGDYGFIGATFVFIFVSLKIFSRLVTKYVFIISAATAISVYVIFTHGLTLPMPR